jgi:cold shock CspA family protein
MIGTIVFFRGRVGFIRRADGTDLYFDRQGLAKGVKTTDLVDGCDVSFEEVQGEKSAYAVEVTPIR